MLTSTPEGATDYIDADLRDPEKVLEAAKGTLDFAKPVALMLMGSWGTSPTMARRGRSSTGCLVRCRPVVTWRSNDGTNVISKQFEQAQEGYNRSGAVPYILRGPEQIAGFFEGLELVEPGVVSCPRWRPDPADVAGGLPVQLGLLHRW